MEKSSRNDTVSKEKGQPTADNFGRGLLWFFHVSVSPEIPTSAECQELPGTTSQESFRYTNFDQRVCLCVLLRNSPLSDLTIIKMTAFSFLVYLFEKRYEEIFKYR